MTDNYTNIIHNNLAALKDKGLEGLEHRLPAKRTDDVFEFRAFGETCRLSPQSLTLGGAPPAGPLGIILSLYALHAPLDPCLLSPFKAFKELPNSMPYVAAFASHTQQILVPYVGRIKANADRLKEALNGQPPPSDSPGDVVLTVYPLPKIALCYVFYEADEDFPASATCLYSNNAPRFLPTDALADVGEYTSRKIIDLLA